jgi:hypothetical protein
MHVRLASVSTTILLGGVVCAALANETSRAKAHEAMVVCESVERMAASDKAHKLERLGQGLAMGEEAVRTDDQDARAHLALSCNLGKQLEISGLSWRVFGQLRRLQSEVDRAYELAPDDPDVLVFRGELLRRTPGPLGGNREEGRALLVRAVEIRPDHVVARVYLARALAEDRSPAARAQCAEALAIARKAGAEREESEVQHLLVMLGE